MIHPVLGGMMLLALLPIIGGLVYLIYVLGQLEEPGGTA